MGPVVADLSVSVDGFVADEHDQVGQVFSWYGLPQPEETLEQAQRRAHDAEIELGKATGLANELGVILYGRRTFELAKGWGGKHPLGVPVIVVTHEVPDGWPLRDSTVSFCTEGIEAALAEARVVAGSERTIAIGTPTLIAQLLELGLLDGIRMSVVPVLLGRGIRYFDLLANGPISLEGPLVREGNGVTHLSYRVLR